MRSPAVGRRGMVATSSPYAALAGVRALARGGNAADAALAAAGVLAVCEPNQCGVGGDLFALVMQDGAPAAGLNASGRSPAEPTGALPETFGPRSVTVPGCPAGWSDLAGRFARHGLPAALEPAIELAERGVTIPPKAARGWELAHAELEADAAEQFRLRQPFRNPLLAGVLREIAEGRFYTGAIAAAVAGVCWLSERDLAEHRNDWVEPLRFGFGGATLLELPPNGQGSIAGWALEALDGDLSRPAQVEALAAAYTRGYATIGGTAYVCAADGEGMAVSLIQSVYYGFGSRVLVPGGGFVLQNRAAGFVTEAGHPNRFEPSKRPFHTIIPAGLEDADGRWTAAFGVTGGEYQPQGHVQVAVNLVGHGLDPQAVLDVPRYRLNDDGSVWLEPPLADEAATFAGRTVEVMDDPAAYGNGHLIVRAPDGLLAGGTEPRRDGLAVGL